MDLGSWLRDLGLSQYEAAFRENAIDPSILPDLTDQDLEKIGVLLGHRRKLLRAIANLDSKQASASNVATIGNDGCVASRRCRASPSHSDVLGPCGLNVPVNAHGS
jgi:hypothetical protein